LLSLSPDRTKSDKSEGGEKQLLIPMSETLFRMEGLPYFRVKNELENGKVIGIRGLYDDGRTDFNHLN
jgi:hypothetical protein